jgi:RHS repeat-associated protein
VILKGWPIMSYRYNGAGERVYRQGGDRTVHTVFDQAGHWLGDYDANGQAIQEAIWLGYQPVGLLAKIAGNTRLFHIEADALGSPRAVIDPIRSARGTVVWRWELPGEAFGNDKPIEDPDGDNVLFVLDLRYPGQQYDSASGFNYNYFRDYDPGTGRYAQSDPIGLNGGISTYRYVSGRPLNLIDPSGLASAIPYSPPVPSIPWGWVRAVGGRAGGAGAAAGAGWWIGTKVHDRYETQISGAVDSVVSTCAKLARPKCLPATTANIVGALSTSEMISQQPTVSMTFIQMYVVDIEGGVPLPPIRVDGNIIVDGNHRYIAHRLCRMEAARQEWVASPSAMRVPMQQLIIQP